ncbi:MAG: hypothetical protein EXS14_04055 [Planctomycetes bacterium]|nr:hypothetical protein [Planctomycetota bacterium]
MWSRFLLVAALAAVTLPAQVLDATIAVSDNQSGSADTVFGVARDASGTKLYAALCGNLAPWTSPPAQWGNYNNDNVVRIDLASGLQDATGVCGLFPEEIALTRNPDGSTRHVWVSNSSSGTVTRLNADLTGALDINLTPCWGSNFGSVWPFGILASADSSRVYVQGTACGTLDAIDAVPTSPTFSTIVSTINVPDMFGRPVWVSAQVVAVPYTTYNYDPILGYSTSSVTGIKLVDVQLGAVVATISAGPLQLFAYPSITDIVCTPAGKVLGAVGYSMAPQLVEFDVASGSVSRTLNFSPILVGLGLHGVGLSPDAATCVITDMLGQQVVFVDVDALALTGIVSTGAGSQPNETVFSRDGSRMYVSHQGAPVIQRWRQLPGYDLRLTIPTAPLSGSTANITLGNIEASSLAGLFISLTPGPTPLGPLTLGLGLPFEFFALVAGDADGRSALPVTVPMGFAGLSFWFQAATVDADSALRLSNTVQVTVQ